MTGKQKNEILTLLAVTKSDLVSAKKSMNDLREALKSADELTAAARVASITRVVSEAETSVDEVIDNYSHLLEDLRSQAARILRLSLDVNDLEIQ